MRAWIVGLLVLGACAPRVEPVVGVARGDVYGAIAECKREAMGVAVGAGYSSVYAGVGGPLAAWSYPGQDAGTAAYRGCMERHGWRTEDVL